MTAVKWELHVAVDIGWDEILKVISEEVSSAAGPERADEVLRRVIERRDEYVGIRSIGKDEPMRPLIESASGRSDAL